MKKLFFVISSICGYFSVSAQYSEGGIPLSMDPMTSGEVSAQQYIQTVSLAPPDIEAFRYQDKTNPEPGLCRIGALVATDLGIKNSGSILSLRDGRKIWRLKIQMPGMQALGLYYDQFHLSEGVKYYIFNSSGRQILGAYTANENPDDGIWANEKVQGEMMTLEMDIDANVDISTIRMHIDKVGVFYKETQYLAAYDIATANMRTTSGPGFPYKGSSACEINAACSTSVSSYTNQSNATMHIEYVKGSFIYGGTGTMVNNTLQNCTPYVLTASHVEPTNSTTNSTFSNWVFYYHYEAPTCVYSGSQPSYKTMTGAYFRARASYDSSVTGIKGDFLLLELKSSPALSYNYYFAGWDTADAISPLVETFICYHHPSGDIKKVSTGTTAFPNGSFNLSNGGLANSHWDITFNEGGIEEGSSGSALFNSTGRIIGILSGGNTSSSCTDTNSSGQKMNIRSEFSKLSLDWSYNIESPSTPSSRLRDWLDPSGSRASTLDGMAGCTVGIIATKTKRQDEIIYPNPTNSIVYFDMQNADSKAAIYNVRGEKLKDIFLKNNNSIGYKIDLSNYPSGVYFLRVTANNSTYFHKIILNK